MQGHARPGTVTPLCAPKRKPDSLKMPRKKAFQNKQNPHPEWRPRCPKPRGPPSCCTPSPLGQHPIWDTHSAPSRSSGLRTHPGYKCFPAGRCGRGSKKKKEPVASTIQRRGAPARSCHYGLATLLLDTKAGVLATRYGSI